MLMIREASNYSKKTVAKKAKGWMHEFNLPLVYLPIIMFKHNTNSMKDMVKWH